MTATLAILVRAVSAGPLTQAVDRALVPLMAVGVLAGAVPGPREGTDMGNNRPLPTPGKNSRLARVLTGINAELRSTKALMVFDLWAVA